MPTLSVQHNDKNRVTDTITLEAFVADLREAPSDLPACDGSNVA